MQVTVTMKWFIFIKVLCNLFMTVEMNSNDIHSDFMSYKLWGFVIQTVKFCIQRNAMQIEEMSCLLWVNLIQIVRQWQTNWSYAIQAVRLWRTRCDVMPYKVQGNVVQAVRSCHTFYELLFYKICYIPMQVLKYGFWGTRDSTEIDTKFLKLTLYQNWLCTGLCLRLFSVEVKSYCYSLDIPHQLWLCA